jgi:FkbH-like protein
MDTIKQLQTEGRQSEALREIFSRARATDDFNTYMSLCRQRRKIDAVLAGMGRAEDLRIAILGGATTDFLEQPLKLELETLGLGSTVFCADFNNYVPELLDANSKSAAFRPNVAVVLVTPHNIADWPAVGDSPEAVQALVHRVSDQWLGLCEAFHKHTNCEIVLSNLHLLPTRAAGNVGTKLPWDRNSFLRQINLALGRKAPAYVHILDIETLSAIYGISNWFDARFWHHAKQPVSFACVVPLVRNLASIIGALYGRTAKCLVVDLDNTLWGGVVGDDGVGGLKIGEGDAEGEAFKAFQEYLLLLKKRGLLLAVCSKNDEANALEPFAALPDMVLKREDFVSFKANWDPKPGNIEQIARELNIGLDALVFVDDNPAERELVRQSLPQVKVVELSSDPADFPLLLDQCGWLDVVKLTDEDIRKTDQYLENLQRDALMVQHADYDTYLASLEQKAVLREFEPTHLDRITQLINKTNQFNLTTRRLTRSEVEALAGRDDTVTAYVRLVDRFGDNGLISVVIGHREGAVLHIDVWLMSCRVLKRGVERLLANHLFERARAMNVESVRGAYIPTAKNRMVENLYRELGFAPAGNGDDGTLYWELRVQDYKPEPVQITVSAGAEI